MRTTTILAAVILAGTLTSTPARAADVHVGVNIGIPAPVYHFDAPPELVVVPGVPHVRYAPNVDVNFFAYGERYYTYHDGGWFVAADQYGPWSYVEPRYVPAPVLRVPVRYYHVAPRHYHYGQARYPRGKGHWKHDDYGGRGHGHGGHKGGGKGHHKHH